MNKYANQYEQLLTLVEKPARYSGGEYNCAKNFDKGVKFCLCFPDSYEVAISNLGNKIIYHYLNSLDGYSCERCYSPWIDMAALLKEKNLPLFSLDTRTPLGEFDALGFSLSYEMCYTNMLDMMALSFIPLKSCDRGEEYPIIFAGGVCTVNPEPFAPFVDFVVLGEGEENLTPVLDLIKEYKDNKKSKKWLLEEVDKLYFAYVPSFHDEVFENGKFIGLTNNPNAKKAIVKDFENCYFPTNQLVPNIQAVHDRAVLEIFRGCPRGCRFCQAGFGYRPIRGRRVETLLKMCEELIDKTGFDEISLNSLSTGDYPCIEELVKGLYDTTKKRGIKLSLPSLRLDSFDSDKAEGIKKNGSLTFAPEAGSQRLRNVINKDISEEEYEKALTEAFKSGYRSVKLYFMIGLPTETEEDIKGIFDMCLKAKRIYKQITGRKDVSIAASVANFVPKPFTPFETEPQDRTEQFEAKHKYLRELFYHSGFKLNYHNAFTSKLEACFALGGRDMAKVLFLAYQKGARFDGWSEFFNREIWQEALKECNIDVDDYTDGYKDGEVLPWYFIDVGVSRKFLQLENKRAKEGILTGGCNQDCKGCGANALGECKLCF